MENLIEKQEEELYQIFIETEEEYLREDFTVDDLKSFISKVRKESIEFERERIRKFYKGALKSANTGKKEYRFDSLKDYMDKCFKIFI